jgi:hypothetical protein
MDNKVWQLGGNTCVLVMLVISDSRVVLMRLAKSSAQGEIKMVGR